MFELLLDLASFRRDPERAGPGFARLLDLIRDGHVRVHVSEDVATSFVTALAKEHRDRIESAIAELTHVPPRVLGDEGEGIKRGLRNLASRIAVQTRAEFDQWLKSMDAILEVTPVPLEASGTPALSLLGLFRSKVRPEEPASTRLWSTATALAKKYGRLNVISREFKTVASREYGKQILVFDDLPVFVSNCTTRLNQDARDRLIFYALDKGIFADMIYEELPSKLDNAQCAVSGLPGSVADIEEVEELDDDVVFSYVDSNAFVGDELSIPFEIGASFLTWEYREFRSDEEIPDEWGDWHDDIVVNGAERSRVRRVEARVKSVLKVVFTFDEWGEYVSNDKIARVAASAYGEVLGYRIVSAELAPLDDSELEGDS